MRIPIRRGLILLARRIQLRQRMRQLLELLLHRPQLIENAQALLKNGPPGKRQAILRQIAHRHALHPLHAAIIEPVQPAQNLHQRRLARAVRPHQRGLLRRSNQPIGIFKEESRTETFARAGELQHTSILSRMRLLLLTSAQAASRQNEAGICDPAITRPERRFFGCSLRSGD